MEAMGLLNILLVAERESFCILSLAFFSLRLRSLQSPLCFPLFCSDFGSTPVYSNIGLIFRQFKQSSR